MVSPSDGLHGQLLEGFTTSHWGVHDQLLGVHGQLLKGVHWQLLGGLWIAPLTELMAGFWEGFTASS